MTQSMTRPAKPFVVVAWRDAHANAISWFSEHEIPHAALEVQSVGWLLREDEAGITVAAEYCGDATWRGVSFVPRGMVVSVSPVVKPRKAHKVAETP